MFSTPLGVLVASLKLAGVAFGVWICKHIYNFFILPWFSPLRSLPGPRCRGFLHSHAPLVMNPHWSPQVHEKFSKKYGKNIRIKGFGWFDDRLLTLDHVTISYILNHAADYDKPWPTRSLIGGIIGYGLLAAEGSHHRRQRKVMNPAFSPSNLRALTPIFFAKAAELRDKWISIIPDPVKGEKLNVCHWLSRATFDVIGLAGFDYTFNAIQNEDEPVYQAYKEMFETTVNKGHYFREFLGIYYPIVDVLFPTKGVKIIRKCKAVIYRAGAELVERKKIAIAEGKESKDLLTLLMKANIDPSLPASQRISDEEVMYQINTFLFAGSDTTSLALTWTFQLLAQNLSVQDRLREELLAISANTPDEPGASFSQEIDALPYLDKVCRESLRLIPPVHSSIRAASKDDVLPATDKPEGIKIAKGQFIHVAIEGFNLDKDAWGEDAHEFNPNRWDNLPESVKKQPGLYSNIMTFSAGPRSCIGQRFSIIELKVFLFTLIPAFIFDEPEKITMNNIVLTRPYVTGKFNEGTQLPLRVRPYVS